MHFTYLAEKDANDLHQGDVLQRTSELVEILKSVHPHYASDQYCFFQIITQSCDLVRRDGKPCTTPYVTIAALRPMSVAVARFAKTLQYDEIERRLDFCSKERQPKLDLFLERLLNNNQEKYFYLHAEAESGLLEDYCTFLQLSVALKSDLHYDSLLRAKVLQLQEPFEHKLGYLVGSSYSRVGTQDYPRDSAEYKATFKRHSQSVQMNWLEKDEHNAVMKGLKLLPPAEQTEQKLLELSKAVIGARSKRKDDALRIIADAVRGAGVADDLVNKAVRRLSNDAAFKATMKL